MSSINRASLPRGCRLIDFPEKIDRRGVLSFAEGHQHIPFQIERVFWIYGVPEGEIRGDHAHNESSEVVVPVSGSFLMVVDDGVRRVEIFMDSPSQGILIPPGVWCELSSFAPGTVCVVLASHSYNASGYTHNYKQYRESLTTIKRYNPLMESEWNEFVRNSKNGTFLLERGYMDYHSDRFTDSSLMFYKQNRLIALLPANWQKEQATVESHGGLTYGGVILSPNITAVETLQVFIMAIDWMKRELEAHRWIYKAIPYIYSKFPAEEDLYALFRCDARIKSRAVSSVVERNRILPMRQIRKRGVAKANRNRVVVHKGNIESHLDQFWNILTGLLGKKHNTVPTHSVQEMRLLMSRFPDNIALYVALKENIVIAGVVVYTTPKVTHAQYIAASDKGKESGALDMLFNFLIESEYSDKLYFDFGVSTEQGGNFLNEGLIFQKEGFGARSVVYDTYEMLF
ncbi:MAG TPA: FdtA/QdtA family cupin domain-containing protein [Bacteroidaceae bacterium]|nr:FdtA/QdtA family cupin domain-containing protein [Bacteroidaceae bacterium]